MVNRVMAGLGWVAIATLTPYTPSIANPLVTAPIVQQTSQSPTSEPLQAIVQLKGLDAPPPRTQGRATLPVNQLPGTQIYTVPITLAGGNFPFLFDTGASTTLLASPTVQRLGSIGAPVPQDRLNFAVAGDDCPTMAARLHRLPLMSMAQVQVQGLRGLQFTSQDLPDDLAGVLGMDVLGQFDVALHPHRQQLSLSPPTQLPPEWSPRVVPLQRKSGVMLAQVSINGQGPFTFLLDTGADSIFISQRVARQAQLDEATHRPVRIQGFCGIERAVRSQLSHVQLHTHQRHNLEAIVLSSSSILEVLGVDGILGQTFLNQYQQYWRFTPTRTAAGPADGSLLLFPLPSQP